jgi:hemerythrin-like metal-binding protein
MAEYVAWKSSCSVNDPSLDAEHRQIIESIDKLYLPMQGRTPGLAAERLLGSLIQYTRTHFDHEEKRLKEIGYPAFADHKALHDEMMRRTIGLQTHLMSLTASDVLRFLKDWWLEHIQGEDKKYAVHLDAVRVRSNVICANGPQGGQRKVSPELSPESAEWRGFRVKSSA